MRILSEELLAQWIESLPCPHGKNGPFKYLKTSPEIIRLTVMLYVSFLLSLRNVRRSDTSISRQAAAALAFPPSIQGKLPS